MCIYILSQLAKHYWQIVEGMGVGGNMLLNSILLFGDKMLVDMYLHIQSYNWQIVGGTCY